MSSQPTNVTFLKKRLLPLVMFLEIAQPLCFKIIILVEPCMHSQTPFLNILKIPCIVAFVTANKRVR